MTTKFLTFFFGRLKIIAPAADKRTLVLGGLTSDRFHDMGEFRYGFFDVEELNDQFVYGKLVKYKRLLEGEIVDERSHRTLRRSLPYGMVGKSDFFLHHKSGFLAYRPLPTRISAKQFWLVFARLVEIGQDKMLISAQVESRERSVPIDDAFKAFKKILRVVIDIHPTNPSARPVYKLLDQRLKQLQARKMRVEIEAGRDGLSKKALRRDDAYRSLVMARDGYGLGSVYGMAEGRRKLITTRAMPIRKEIAESSDPRVMLDCLLPTFKELWTEKYE